MLIRVRESAAKFYLAPDSKIESDYNQFSGTGRPFMMLARAKNCAVRSRIESLPSAALSILLVVR